MTLKLDKVPRAPHLSTLVASSIAREIAQGRLQPGDQLPTEQTLSETFAVSRNVVREAIARLRSEGHVVTKQGRGAFVSEAGRSTALTISHEGIEAPDVFRGLFELRRLLEGEAAELAALRRREEDIEAMHTLLGRMEQVPYGGVAWLGADLAFHRAIAVATQNTYIEQVLAFVSQRVRESILASGHVQGAEAQARMTLSEHWRICHAIEEGDGIAAKAAMGAHLSEAARRVGLDPTSSSPVDGLRQVARSEGDSAPGGTQDPTAKMASAISN